MRLRSNFNSPLNACNGYSHNVSCDNPQGICDLEGTDRASLEVISASGSVIVPFPQASCQSGSVLECRLQAECRRGRRLKAELQTRTELLFQQRIGINVYALPVAFRVGGHGDREMKVIIPCSGIAGITDISDCFTLLRQMTLSQAVSVSIEMRVIVDEFAINACLIDRSAATLALKELHNWPVRCRQYTCSLWRGNIDGIVDTTFRARF